MKKGKRYAESAKLVEKNKEYQIKEALRIAKKDGLFIPVIYNTNGYEKVETLKMLDGYIDIYLPDLKYY